MTRKNLMLIDGNNIVMRSYYAMAQAGLTFPTGDSRGEACGGVYGTINALRTYFEELKPTHLLWLFDDGRSDLRTAMRDDYKGHRKYASVGTAPKAPNPEVDLPLQFDKIRHWFDVVGIKHYSERGVEADDLIAQAAKRFSRRETDITIVSSDHDLLQLVTDQDAENAIDHRWINVYRPGAPKAAGGSRGLKPKASGVLFGSAEVVDKYELTPEELPVMWALTGDSGDNIAGIPGVGPKTAAKWVLRHGPDLTKILLAEPKCEGYERLAHQNYEMIVLDGSVGNLPYRDLDELSVRYSPDGIVKGTALIDSWGMKSIVDKIKAEGRLL